MALQKRSNLKYNFEMIINYQKRFRIKRSNKGYTIIELLICTAIIGILASISIPSAFKWVEKERQNSYLRELISYFELIKKETRRWNGNCNVIVNTFSSNPYDPVTKKRESIKAFNLNCKGMNNAQKKTLIHKTPKINKSVFQEVSQSSFMVTPKGHISIPNNQTEIVIVIGGRPKSSFYQQPKCVVFEAPIGIINTGVYRQSYRFYEMRYGNRPNSSLRKQVCDFYQL